MCDTEILANNFFEGCGSTYVSQHVEQGEVYGWILAY